MVKDFMRFQNHVIHIFHIFLVIMIFPVNVDLDFVPSNNTVKFESAKMFCQQNDLELAIMKTPTDLKIFYADYESAFNGKCLWVGLQYNANQNIFLWRDGKEETRAWTAWMDNEPDCLVNGALGTSSVSDCPHGNEECIAMDLTGSSRDRVFRTASCTKQDCFAICEKVTPDAGIDSTTTITIDLVSNTESSTSTFTSTPSSTFTETPLGTGQSTVFSIFQKDLASTKIGWSSTAQTVTTKFDSHLLNTVSTLLPELSSNVAATPSVTEQLTTVVVPKTTVEPTTETSEIKLSWQSVDPKISYHFLNDTKLTYYEARTLCEEEKMDLLFIKTETALEELAEFMHYLYDNNVTHHGEFWIGIIWNEKHAKHTWIDMQPVTWAPWYPNHPKCMTGSETPLWKCEGDKNCVVTTPDGLFRTRQCLYKRRVICQKTAYSLRPKYLNCKCPKRKLNQKWHYLDGANITETEVGKMIEEDFNTNVKKNITTEQKTLSSSVRKRTSATDDRPACQGIGGTAAILVGTPILLMVILDVMKLTNAFLCRQNAFKR